MSSLYDFSAPRLDGTPQPMTDYQGQVVLVVNVASKCGFTPQYTGLEALYRAHKDQGFTVLGFPCNQFGWQEPGTDAEIAEFCSTTYDVSFPMFSKVEVNGENTDPIYRFLKSEAPGVLGTEAIKWNFTKFLVGRDGQVIGRYAPDATPESIEPELKSLL